MTKTQNQEGVDSNFNPDLVRNRAIWDKLQYTEKKATKEVTGKGRPMTDINPTWRMLRMTEMFGPCGKSWGWNIDREWEGEVSGKKYAYVKLTLWWSDDNGATKYLVGPHIGGTDMAQGKDEAYKQSVTDAFGKCASMLGVAADVYLGLWSGSDSKYQNEASAAVQAQRNVNLSHDSIEAFEKEIEQKVAKAKTLEQLDLLWKEEASSRIREIGSVNKDAQSRLIATFSRRKTDIMNSDGSDEQSAA